MRILFFSFCIFFRRFQGCQLQWRKKQLRLQLLLIQWESLQAQAQPDWRKLRVFRQCSLKYIWVSFYMSCFLLNFKPVSTELLVILINLVWSTFFFYVSIPTSLKPWLQYYCWQSYLEVFFWTRRGSIKFSG